MVRKPLYTILFVLLYLQTAIAGNWLTNKATSEVTFGEVATIVSRGGSGYCLVQKEGSIFWSNDGNTWTQGVSHSGSNLVMRCAHFHDGKNGVVAGDKILEYTTDGGGTWSEKSVGFNVRGVCMTSSHTAVLVGDGGKIARYTFGGSLEEQFSSTNNTLNSVSFYDGIGYACGDKGVLLKYEGNTWKELTPEVNKNWVSVTDPTGSGKTARLNNISAVDARTAYACGDGGVLLKTVDGGMTWSRRNTESTQDLTAMTFNPDGKLSVSGGKSHLSIDGQTDKHSVKMYYDRLGRVVASQNSKQRAMRPQRFSYTVYDALGRNVEAGELESDAEPTDDMINATGASRFPDNWSASRFQVTRSIYDEPIYLDNSNNAIYKAFGGKQQHLRNRIATTLYQEEYNSDPTKYDHATHYSYDIHGNVATLVQDLPELESIGQRFKRVDYEYGIVSGKVTCMDYQKDSLDGYSLLYNYDGENRVTSVSAKYHGDNTEHELARYEYYRHGPLARMVLGNTLQGVDYAYTLQGWTKGVNADAAGRDMGGDGKNGVKTDVYGYTLQYNEEDYQPIGQNASFCQSVTSADLGGKALYNGNIARMSTYLVNLSTQNFGTQTRSFVYDELNQLRSSQVDGNSNYQTTYTYDANGNLTNLTRNDQSGVAMDNLTYRYATDGSGKILNNRLLHVNDDVQNSANPSDIENQGDNYAQYDPASHNYAYDKMGNLIKDQSEEIAEITWNTAGKVTKVSRIEGSGKPDLQFDYDAIGQRIAKKVINKNVTTGDKFVTTYYVRDSHGNVLAVYEKKEDATGAGEFLLKERHLYGAGRLGMVSQNVSLAQFNTTTADPTQNSTTPQLGDTHYELTNHLGNVMAVITDKATADSTPMIASLSDYYPYGMTEPGRSYSAGNYRYGYTGHEKENNLSDGVYTTEYRLYDARLGRWLSVDPMFAKYSGISSYNYCAGDPIRYKDKCGDDRKDIVLGMFAAVWDNETLGAYDFLGFTNPREYLQRYVSDPRDYNRGQDAGDALSIELSLIEMGTGATMQTTGEGAMALGVVAAPESGGTSLLVSGGGVVISAEGTALLLHGSAVMMMSKNNYANKKGRMNESSSGNASSGGGKNTGSGKNSSKNSSASNEKNTFTQKHGPNGSNEPHKVTTEIPDGYKKIKERTKGGGAPVYSNGKNYISPDLDGHNGGMWKMAKSVDDLGSKSTRMGTYDAKLNRIGD